MLNCVRIFLENDQSNKRVHFEERTIPFLEIIGLRIVRVLGKHMRPVAYHLLGRCWYKSILLIVAFWMISANAQYAEIGNPKIIGPSVVSILIRWQTKKSFWYNWSFKSEQIHDNCQQSMMFKIKKTSSQSFRQSLKVVKPNRLKKNKFRDGHIE